MVRRAAPASPLAFAKRWSWRRVLLASLAVALIVAGYAGGRWHLQRTLGSPEQLSRQAQRAQLTQQSERMTQLEKQLAAAQVNTEVEQRTLQALQATLARQQRIISGLREEVGIWRGLSDGTEGSDLKIRSWNVWSLPQVDRFAYRLVIQQRSAQGSEVEGSVQVELIGVDAEGAERTMPLAALSASHPQPAIALRFSHYQALEGELTLHAGFTPQWVQVTATSGTAASEVSSRYAWAVREAGDDVDKG